ncbi:MULTISPECIES: hypothetical protein [unclassified Rhodococcus (in: high G+C Gram-positive bacteria)]|jgi:hypothetical protein|nr:hypothetical protein [Rhodococcus sp. DK17]
MTRWPASISDGIGYRHDVAGAVKPAGNITLDEDRPSPCTV